MSVFVQINGVTWQMAQGEDADEVRNRILANSESGQVFHLQVATPGGRGSLTLDGNAIWSLLVFEGEEPKGRSGEVW